MTAFACRFFGPVATKGHGWGYRYLHGFLGSLCLLAAGAWVDLSESDGKGRAWACLAAGTGLALAVWLPMRLYQVETFIPPYARAGAAIARSPAEVVIVDPHNLFYGPDLVRNDPFFGNNAKVMDANDLSISQIKWVCGHHKVEIFDKKDGIIEGLKTTIDVELSGLTPADQQSKRDLIRNCGPHVVFR